MTESDTAERKAFIQKLFEVAQYGLDREREGDLDKDDQPAVHTTRQDIYERFVCAEGSKIADGCYDDSKPFAAELKLLFDLIYNVNLPDALGVHALTPIDSPPRTVLLDWEASRIAENRDITADDIFKLVSRAAFSAVQTGLNFHSFYDLRLTDVRELRKTAEWTGYMEVTSELIRDPFSDDDGGLDKIRLVYDRYFEALKRIARIRAAGRAEQQEREWKPYIDFVVDVAGVGASVGAQLLVASHGDGLASKFAGGAAQAATKHVAPVVIRMIIRGGAFATELPDLGTSFVLMRGRMADAAEQWRELEKMIQADGRFKDRPDEVEGLRATLNDSQHQAA